MAAPPSRISSPYGRNRSRSAFNSSFAPPPSQLPPASSPAPAPPSAQQQYGHSQNQSDMGMGMVHMTVYAPGMASVPATTSSSHSPTAAYQYVASVVNAASGSGTQHGHQTEIALNTHQGTIVVPVDTRTGSKNSDVHRKKNAQASKRHRQRKKEDFQSLKVTVTEQEHRIHDLEHKITDLETRNRELENEIERFRAYAEQHSIPFPPPPPVQTMAPTMVTLPPITTISRDIPRGSVTPGLRMGEATDYFGSVSSSSFSSQSAREPVHTPLPGIHGFGLGPVPRSRAQSMAPLSGHQTPTSRISPELMDRVRPAHPHLNPLPPPPPLS